MTMMKFLAGKIFGRKNFFFIFFVFLPKKPDFLYNDPKFFFPSKPLRKILIKISGADFRDRFLLMGSIES